MKIFKLVFKNAFRHKLRTILTMIALAVVVMAFVLMRMIIGAWNAGVAGSSANRLVVVHRVSFIFQLPYAYGDRIRRLPGVSNITWADWFGGIYIDRKFENFFARYAVEGENFFKIYPEFKVPPDQMEAFTKERNACIIGIKTAQQHNFKLGDTIQLTGDIYPGQWDFIVRGIYVGKDKSTDETGMFFHWDYLDERLKQTVPRRAGQVGWYVVELGKATDGPRISQQIDDMFKSSNAPTKAETEKAFQQSFVSMSGAIIKAIDVVSFVIIGVILLVLVNTMAMTARERIKEYAVLKTLGYTGAHIFGLIGGESLMIGAAGGALGLLLSYPAIQGFQAMLPTWFPIIPPLGLIMTTAGLIALLVGIVAAIFPSLRATRMRIADGLRQTG